jgi:competence ComEA-like helix-hairpin-helix protein
VPPTDASAAEESTAEEIPEIDDTEAAFAWLESLAVKQGADEALLLSPEERLESAPEWVQQAAEAAAEEDLAAIEEAAKEETELETEPPVLEESPLDAQTEEQPSDEPPDESEKPTADIDDADAAFAWLESLAVRQGADEALLLSPEERLDTPPKWVQESVDETSSSESVQEKIVSEDEPIEERGAIDADEAFAWLEGLADRREPDEPIEIEEPQLEKVTSDDEIPEPTIPTMKDDSLEGDITEAGAIEEAPVEAVSPESDVPDLPDWLAAEPDAGSTDKLEWKLPPVRLDINKTSLAEFEKLPGIGFILAQRIVNYRENMGDFQNVDELLKVPGFSQFIMDGLEDRLFVATSPKPQIEQEAETAELPEQFIILSSESESEELVDARQELNQGELSQALEKYNLMINQNQSLPEVISDLKEAADHFPEDINLWQSLGDAYLRNNQINAALEAYKEAEKLLR